MPRYILADPAIKLIALVRAELLVGHLVVLHRRVIVIDDVFHAEFFSAPAVLIHKEKAARQGFWWFGPIHLTPYLVVNVEIALDCLPGFLRDHQHANAELRHNRHRLRRDCRGVGAAAKRTRGKGPDCTARLINVTTPFHIAGFERVNSETGCANEVVRLAVEMTSAADPLPPWRHPMLPTGYASLGR